jgi:hypothetical protein
VIARSKGLLGSLGRKGSSSLKADLTDFGRVVEKSAGKTIEQAVDELFNGLGTSSQVIGDEPLVCYPNPLNHTSTIRYHIAEESRVDLKVYDLTGRQVTTLVDREQDKGAYEVRFDASSLSGGVYFIRLTTNRGRVVRRILVEK